MDKNINKQTNKQTKPCLKKNILEHPRHPSPIAIWERECSKGKVICLQSPSSGPRCPLSGATASRQTPPY